MKEEMIVITTHIKNEHKEYIEDLAEMNDIKFEDALHDIIKVWINQNRG